MTQLLIIKYFTPKTSKRATYRVLQVKPATMPTVYEARCLNCGNLGHFREECPKVECENCHLLGHTAIDCDRCTPAMKFEDMDGDKDGETSEKEKRAVDDDEFDDFLKMLSSPNADTVEEDQSTSSSSSSLNSFLNFLKTDTTLPDNHSSTNAHEDTTTSDDPASKSGKKEEGELPWRRPWWELQW